MKRTISDEDLKRIIKAVHPTTKVSQEIREIVLDYYDIYAGNNVVYIPFNKLKIK